VPPDEPLTAAAAPPRNRAGRTSAADFLPDSPRPSLKLLRQAAAGCRGCDLYKRATQTVFGEGPARARIMLIGEQPGDQEDRQGHVFVGPAGGLLNRALAEAGLGRGDIFLTNAVKHFKWTPSPRGKKRLHGKPSAGQVRACRPWLEAELARIKPRIVVVLGATAAQSLYGPGFRVTRQRGRLLDGAPWAPKLVATVHPSSILRAPDDESRREQYAAFVADLRLAAAAAGQAPS
jgi:DNA polymerase